MLISQKILINCSWRSSPAGCTGYLYMNRHYRRIFAEFEFGMDDIHPGLKLSLLKI